MFRLFVLSCYVSFAFGRLTFVNFSPVVQSTDETHLYCLDTKRLIPLSNLTIERALDTGNGDGLPSPAIISNNKLKTNWGRETGDGRFGVFRCSGGAPEDTVVTMKMFRSDIAVLEPQYLSITVSVGDSLDIKMTKTQPIASNNPIKWRLNGIPFDFPSPSAGLENPGDVDNYVYHVDHVSSYEGGIYEAHPLDNRSHGALTRVVVRACQAGSWNPPNCDRTCPQCNNGGVCHDTAGKCVCPPGFMGPTCSTECGANKYGEQCDLECDADGCRKYQFCLPDPYGCSCATGWKGIQCDQPCELGTYGPDCKLSCQCQNGGSCDRYRGCECVGGWSGPTCESQELYAPNALNPPALKEAGTTSLRIDPFVEPYSGDGPITNVVLWYKKTTVNSWSDISIPDTDYDDFTLGGLESDTEYQLKIRLTGPTLLGRPGPILRAKTSCQALSVPSDVVLDVEGSTSIRVTWSAFAGQDIVGYKLVYGKSGNSNFSIIRVSDPSQLSFVINNLTPYTEYVFAVAGVNCAGDGTPSALQAAMTEQDAPGPVQYLQLTSHSKDTIIARWEVPLQKNGIIRYYELALYENDVLTRDRIGRTTVDTNMILPGLHPYYLYRVVVWAVTVTKGDTAEAEVRTSQDAPSGPPQNLIVSHATRDSITYEWQPPILSEQNGIITRYEYTFRNANGGSRTMRYTSDTTVTMNNLVPNTPYSFKVKAFTTVGGGPDSDELIKSTLEVSAVTTAKTMTTTAESVVTHVATARTRKGTAVTKKAQRGKSSEAPYKFLTTAMSPKSGGLFDINSSITSAVIIVIGVIAAITLILLLGCAVGFVVYTRKRRERKLRRQSLAENSVQLSEIQRQPSQNNDYREGDPGDNAQQQSSSGMACSVAADTSGMIVPAHLDFWRIPWDKILFEDRIIAEGNFGIVMKATIKQDDHDVIDVALKVLKDGATDSDKKDFIGELEIMCKVGKHPNIVNLIGACERGGILYVATEFARYGNLLNILRVSRVLETDPNYARKTNMASTYSAEQLLGFAADVALGMTHLSEKGCVHRDLAARNILIYDNFVAKVADFGLSRSDEVYVKMTAGRLPVRWMAIESLNFSVYTTKSDVWSFGILLWEIITLGGTPYPGLTCAELYQQLPRKYRMPKPLNCEAPVYEIMRQCWRERPYDRPDFGQLYMALKKLIQDAKPYVNMEIGDNFEYANINISEETEHATPATVIESNEVDETKRLLSNDTCAANV
ncbi:angiopoietin-1 receptor-like [Saccoglossus kowalevskii]|uniref:receptor protein-tyrosine kinase n=1 Tax=Saccoglossus kowalevskii TaxID=10224 RepID=A0ABM0GVE7_SACKO|nr:PREDICTED: tyrosine-protein kinase receptor Tie-1-like [Saccoglossus kowalevskii]